MTSGLAGRPIFTSPRVLPSSAASEEDPNSKGDSRMRRTNSFGERADRAKTLKQGSGSTSAKSSSGPVNIDRTSTQQSRATVSQPSTRTHSARLPLLAVSFTLDPDNLSSQPMRPAEEAVTLPQHQREVVREDTEGLAQLALSLLR